MEFSHQNDTLIFVFSFLSIIPLAGLLGFATEVCLLRLSTSSPLTRTQEVALRTGPTIGGLLNATVCSIPSQRIVTEDPSSAMPSN